jgi:alpha-beta hydrolase superfamily lysophospholipase
MFRPVMSSNDTTIERLPAAKNARGTFLVIHGINNRPEVMMPLAGVLSSAGYHVHLVKLSGHRPGTKSSFEGWQNDIREGYERAEKLSPNMPIFGLGYSAGASALVASSLAYKKLILLAPSVGTRPMSEFMKVFLPLRHLGIPGFSLSPSGYRYSRFPSLDMYSALFETHARIQTLSLDSPLRATPVLIFYNEKDELLSYKRTKQWTERAGLKNTSWHSVQPNPTLSYSSQHLILDEPTVGQEEWDRIKNAIEGFLMSESLNQ